MLPGRSLREKSSVRDKGKGLLPPSHQQGGLLPPSHQNGLLPSSQDKESLGSDGETSDYQRSTPSPRDGDSRITELISEDKCEDMGAESWKGGLDTMWNKGTGSSLSASLSPSLSPDLGFVDCPEMLASARSFPTSCDKKLPFVCITSLKSEHASSLRRYSFPSRGYLPHQTLPDNTAKHTLHKKVSVDIEKLPSLTLASDRLDTNMFLVNSRHHPALAKSRFDSGRTKEISLPSKGLLLNSFRVAKNSSKITKKDPHTNFAGLPPRTFYNKDPFKFNESHSDKSEKTDITTSNLESCSPESQSSLESSKQESESSLETCSRDTESLLCSAPLTSESSEPTSAASSEIGDTETISAAVDSSRPFRFPTLAGNSSAIPCKWTGCGQGFKSHAKLSDHIKTAHMSPQLAEPGNRVFSCLWTGCKVYAAKSSSSSWLQKHVPLHGGKLTFTCIVEGCTMRFSSQVILERHVNSHFSEHSNGSSQCGPRKSIEGAPARKVLKRAGVKLKFRKLPFSARIFDFFDAGMMAGIRDQVSSVHKLASRFGIEDDHMVFHSKALSLRLGETGVREVQLRWIPENMIPDEWVPLDEALPTKCVKLSLLPETSKVLLQHALLLKPRGGKQSRKRKRTEPPSQFLTPAELKREKDISSVKKRPHPAAGLFS